jgi:putative flavoprotein involved in K+ transport
MNHVASGLLEAAKADQPDDAISQWLERFEAALRDVDKVALASLFAAECHYRDLLAFTWTIRPAEGVAAITDLLAGAQPSIQARNFAVADGRTGGRRRGA